LFGASVNSGKIIYLSFPIETVADDNAFNSVIAKSMNYFEPGIVSVDNELNLVNEFNLFQNYPNPFNPSTVISYQLPVASNVTLKVYDVLGREIATLVNEEKPAGSYEVDFNANGLSSGVYFYTLRLNDKSYSKSMILMK